MTRRGQSAQPVAAVPVRLWQQTEWLAGCIREPADEIARHYVRSVRANVEAVLESTFALTLNHLTPAERDALVNSFVAHHGAIEPTFHQIATELVRHVQHRHREGTLNWPGQRLALLEYEWACLCVEIDDAQVPRPVAGEEVAAGSRLWLNPTLQLLTLPFVICEGRVVAARQPPHFCALFRCPAHQLVSQALREFDVALLQLLGQQQGVSVAELAARVHHYRSGFDLLGWARYFHRLGLLATQPPSIEPPSIEPQATPFQGDTP